MDGYTRYIKYHSCKDGYFLKMPVDGAPELILYHLSGWKTILMYNRIETGSESRENETRTDSIGPCYATVLHRQSSMVNIKINSVVNKCLFIVYYIYTKN